MGANPVPEASSTMGLSESSRRKKLPNGPSMRRMSRSFSVVAMSYPQGATTRMSGAAPAFRQMIDKMNNGGKIAILGIAPAGFEIDNPNLMSAGSLTTLGWLDTETDVAHSEFRQDRFLTAIDRMGNDTFKLAYIVRAISPGTFHHPAASVEDMYRPDFRARTATETVTITE